MSDITKCDGVFRDGKLVEACSNCYRTKAKSHEFRQSYFSVVPGKINKNGELACNYYWPVEK